MSKKGDNGIVSDNTKLDFSFIEIPEDVREDIAQAAAAASNDQKRWEFGTKFVSMVEWLRGFWDENEADIAAELEPRLGRKLRASDRRGFIAQKRAELVSISGFSRSWCAHLESMARFYSGARAQWQNGEFSWYRLEAAKSAGEDNFEQVLLWARNEANTNEMRKNCLPPPDEMRHKAMLITGRKHALPLEIERARRAHNALRLMLEDKARNLYPPNVIESVAKTEELLEKFVEARNDAG